MGKGGKGSSCLSPERGAALLGVIAMLFVVVAFAGLALDSVGVRTRSRKESVLMRRGIEEVSEAARRIAAQNVRTMSRLRVPCTTMTSKAPSSGRARGAKSSGPP